MLPIPDRHSECSLEEARRNADEAEAPPSGLTAETSLVDVEDVPHGAAEVRAEDAHRRRIGRLSLEKLLDDPLAAGPTESASGAACRAASGRAGAPGDAKLAAAGPSRPDLRSRRADAVGRWRSEPSHVSFGMPGSVGDAPLVVEPPPKARGIYSPPAKSNRAADTVSLALEPLLFEVLLSEDLLSEKIAAN